MQRKGNRKIPLEAILEFRSAPPHRIVRPDIDRARRTGLVIDETQITAVRTADHDVRVIRFRCNVAAFAAGGRLPVAHTDGIAERGT